jgi:hypothetical protein
MFLAILKLKITIIDRENTSILHSRGKNRKICVICVLKNIRFIFICVRYFYCNSGRVIIWQVLLHKKGKRLYIKALCGEKYFLPEYPKLFRIFVSEY